MENSYDFIVIGSGFGGSVAALRLSEKGYSVLVTEKGKKYSSGDFHRRCILPINPGKSSGTGKKHCNLIIFLVMQHLENSMKFIWKKSLPGGKMAVSNKGNLKVPAYIEIGQKVMEAYAKHTGGMDIPACMWWTDLLCREIQV